MSQASLPLPTHAGDKIIWANLDQTASAWAIANAARAGCKPLLVITPDSNRANSLEEELNFSSGVHLP